MTEREIQIEVSKAVATLAENAVAARAAASEAVAALIPVGLEQGEIDAVYEGRIARLLARLVRFREDPLADDGAARLAGYNVALALARQMEPHAGGTCREKADADLVAALEELEIAGPLGESPSKN